MGGPGADPLAGLKLGVAVIAVLLSAFALWALRHILTPFALALFLLLVIDGAARALTARLKVPASVALPAAVAVVLIAFGMAVWILAGNAAHMAHQAGAYAARLDAVTQETTASFGLRGVPTIAELVHRINAGHFAAVFAGGAGRVLESGFFVLVYLGFLLASRRTFEGKLQELFVESGGRSEALALFARVERGVERYITVQTVGGLLNALASAALMLAVGLPDVAFWAFLIFLASYIPLIGGAVGVLLPPFFALVELDGLWQAAVLIIGLEATHLIVGNIVLPRLQGRSLNIDPVFVLLGLALWGTLWGVPGAFLSTPLTLTLMAVCAEFPVTRPLAVLLSGDGRPFAEDA